MALPIAPTPILEGEEAVDFLRRVELGLKKPSTYVPTPNLWKVVELIKKKKNILTKRYGMKRDDCPYLKANAHDGDWEMICTVDNEECNTNWEQYKECNVYNQNARKERRQLPVKSGTQAHPGTVVSYC